ncbi:MAG: bifunctional glutamate N-acetyltransferase/amino-acid acetyltransferase ArgJ [Bryobacterales bacterium]|nr:bifunctional glutamate N-acetyltransferase/amino-acid acetyltransferase ArgJ [Bryobacterales bacterium]
MIFPLGYKYASTYAKIRKAKKDDLALIVSDAPAVAAAVFTQNRVKAAPVILAQKNLKSSRGKLKAIMVNAGNANCATRTGAEVARQTCQAAAQALAVHPNLILPCSTGVIGVELDPTRITKALPGLVKKLSPHSFQQVAEAIMTTDLVPKTSSAEISLSGGSVTIAGMTKGSGMIQPNMATTLGFLMTDAAIPSALVPTLLKQATDVSYNRISVDGDTSTNDTLVLMANGASAVELTSKDQDLFLEALSRVAQELASKIARDGEGARKLVTIQVNGAKSDDDATRIARGIANSPLVKTAIAGSDPNWGRIISAAGNSGADFDPAKVSIAMQGVLVCENGLAADFSEKQLKKRLNDRDCLIQFQIAGKGKGKSKFWTCDFTEGYIEINGSYRT